MSSIANNVSSDVAGTIQGSHRAGLVSQAAGLLRRQLRSAMRGAGRRLMRHALERIERGGVRVVGEPGVEELRSPRARDGCNAVTVRVLHPDFFAAAAFGGSVGVAEAYMDRLWETDDLAGLVETLTLNVTAMAALEGPIARLLSPLSRAAYWLERNTRSGSRRNIVAHYDLGNEFFATFLDPTMTYSCAIFEHGARSLEEAQREKIDRVCRKLALSARDHVLEIGSGWGALAIHAASRYGCRVTTTTISDEQFREATHRVRAAGLADRIDVVRRDYRDLTGQFDRLVSIEMVEAVGAERLGTFFDVCARRLKPDGAALIQAIVIRDQFFARAARERDFLKRYIFPGSCLPSVGAMIDAMRSRTDLHLVHLEDIGLHYVDTLRLWREAFVSRQADVRAMGFDDRFIRMWEYYLAYCEGAFRARHVGDVQMLLTKPSCRLAPVPSAAPSSWPAARTEGDTRA